MQRNDILLVGMRGQIAAIQRSSGQILWECELPSGSPNFVTLLCQDDHVYACTGGHVHCLALTTGALLWTNKLKGFGYELGSLCIPGSSSAPSIAMVEQHRADERAASSKHHQNHTL